MKRRLSLLLDLEEIQKIKIRAVKEGLTISRYFVKVSKYYEKNKPKPQLK